MDSSQSLDSFLDEMSAANGDDLSWFSPWPIEDSGPTSFQEVFETSPLPDTRQGEEYVRNVQPSTGEIADTTWNSPLPLPEMGSDPVIQLIQEQLANITENSERAADIEDYFEPINLLSELQAIIDRPPTPITEENLAASMYTPGVIDLSSAILETNYARHMKNARNPQNDLFNHHVSASSQEAVPEPTFHPCTQNDIPTSQADPPPREEDLLGEFSIELYSSELGFLGDGLVTDNLDSQFLDFTPYDQCNTENPFGSQICNHLDQPEKPTPPPADSRMSGDNMFQATAIDDINEPEMWKTGDTSTDWDICGTLSSHSVAWRAPWTSATTDMWKAPGSKSTTEDGKTPIKEYTAETWKAPGHNRNAEIRNNSEPNSPAKILSIPESQLTADTSQILDTNDKAQIWEPPCMNTTADSWQKPSDLGVYDIPPVGPEVFLIPVTPDVWKISEMQPSTDMWKAPGLQTVDNIWVESRGPSVEDTQKTSSSKPTNEMWQQLSPQSTAATWKTSERNSATGIWERTDTRSTAEMWNMSGIDSVTGIWESTDTQPTAAMWNMSGINSATGIWESTDTQPTAAMWNMSGRNSAPDIWESTDTQPTAAMWNMSGINSAPGIWESTDTQPTAAMWNMSGINSAPGIWESSNTQPTAAMWNMSGRNSLAGWESKDTQPTAAMWNISVTNSVAGIWETSYEQAMALDARSTSENCRAPRPPLPKAVGKPAKRNQKAQAPVKRRTSGENDVLGMLATTEKCQMLTSTGTYFSIDDPDVNRLTNVNNARNSLADTELHLSPDAPAISSAPSEPDLWLLPATQSSYYNMWKTPSCKALFADLFPEDTKVPARYKAPAEAKASRTLKTRNKQYADKHKRKLQSPYDVCGNKNLPQSREIAIDSETSMFAVMSPLAGPLDEQEISIKPVSPKICNLIPEILVTPDCQEKQNLTRKKKKTPTRRKKPAVTPLNMEFPFDDDFNTLIKFVKPLPSAAVSQKRSKKQNLSNKNKISDGREVKKKGTRPKAMTTVLVSDKKNNPKKSTERKTARNNKSISSKASVSEKKKRVIPSKVVKIPVASGRKGMKSSNKKPTENPSPPPEMQAAGQSKFRLIAPKPCTAANPTGSKKSDRHKNKLRKSLKKFRPILPKVIQQDFVDSKQADSSASFPSNLPPNAATDVLAPFPASDGAIRSEPEITPLQLVVAAETHAEDEVERTSGDKTTSAEGSAAVTSATVAAETDAEQVLRQASPAGFDTGSLHNLTGDMITIRLDASCESCGKSLSNVYALERHRESQHRNPQERKKHKKRSRPDSREVEGKGLQTSNEALCAESLARRDKKMKRKKETQSPFVADGLIKIRGGEIYKTYTDNVDLNTMALNQLAAAKMVLKVDVHKISGPGSENPPVGDCCIDTTAASVAGTPVTAASIVAGTPVTAASIVVHDEPDNMVELMSEFLSFENVITFQTSDEQEPVPETRAFYD